MDERRRGLFFLPVASFVGEPTPASASPAPTADAGFEDAPLPSVLGAGSAAAGDAAGPVRVRGDTPRVGDPACEFKAAILSAIDDLGVFDDFGFGVDAPLGVAPAGEAAFALFFRDFEPAERRCAGLGVAPSSAFFFWNIAMRSATLLMVSTNVLLHTALGTCPSQTRGRRKV